MSESAAWRVLTRAILLVFALLLFVFLMRELQPIVVQLLLAVLLAAAASPLVNGLTSSNRARRWRWQPGRGLAALVVFLAALMLLVLGSVIVGASVAPDLSALAANLPTYAVRAQVALDELIASNPELASRVSGAIPSLPSLLGGAVGLLGQASRVLSVATAAFGAALYLVFTLILSLYLTIDGVRIRNYLIRFLPFDRHAQAMEIADRIATRLGAWARGEALLAVIIGSLTWLGALVLGLPYAAALALIAAVGELIPNLGPIIAAIPLIVVGFLQSPTQGLFALAIAVLIQQLENNLIVPRVMSQAVNLHPVAVMLAILAGNELLGIPGALLAVPVVASLSVVIEEIQRERLQRHLGLVESAPGDGQRELAYAGDEPAEVGAREPDDAH